MRGFGKPLILMLTLSVKCWAMSRSEVEDFSNFLRKTSVLDQNLKDGFGSDHEADEVEEAISDDAWEQSGKFEGDLILNDRQRRLIVEDVAEGLSRNGLRDSAKRWPDNEVIYYIQREHFSSDQVRAIQDGIDDLARASCVKFRPYQKGDRDAVVIQGSRRGCFSQVGYQGGYQVLNLSGRHPVGRGCFRHGTVVHELLHTLGFFHMQSSPDRDDYIDVVWENIVQPARHNFKKYNTFSVSDFGVGYDYESVLHYGRRAFSNNGQDTLVPKKDGAEIGQRIGLSDKDTQKLNKMYCDSGSDDHAEEEVPQKHNHKKKPSNQPFQGHGIGYHQGKAVVIKLPEAETFSLTDKPIHKQMFDYFSKSPKAVLPKFVQEFGTGKKVNENPMKSIIDNNDDFIKELSKKHDYNFNKFTKDYYPKDIETTTHRLDNKQISKYSHDIMTEDSANEEEDGDIESERFDFHDYIAKLDKIVKAKVYPSQKENDNFLFNKEEYNGILPKGIEIKTKKEYAIFPNNDENNQSDSKEISTHEENGNDFSAKQFDFNIHYPDHPDVNKYSPQYKKESKLMQPQIITTTTDKYDEQEESEEIIISKFFPSQQENDNFSFYKHGFNEYHPKNVEITTQKNTNTSPNDEESDSREPTTREEDGDDFGASRFDGHVYYKEHQISSDTLPQYEKEYNFKQPQISKTTSDRNKKKPQEFRKSDSEKNLADDAEKVFRLKSVKDHFTDLDKVTKGKGAYLSKEDNFLSYRNEYNRLNNLRKSSYFPKSDTDNKSDDETFEDHSFLFSSMETEDHLVPKDKKRGKKYKYYSLDDSYIADTSDGYPEDKSILDDGSEHSEDENIFDSDNHKKLPHKYQLSNDSKISYHSDTMNNDLVNKSTEKNIENVDARKENKSEQQIIKKGHDCVEVFKEDNTDLPNSSKTNVIYWNPNNKYNKSSKIANNYTSTTETPMESVHSREESKPEYNPKSEVIILKQHKLREEIEISPGKKRLEPNSFQEDIAKIVRNADVKTLMYSSAEKIDHDAPFSTVQPVRYEVVNNLPYTSDDAYSRDNSKFDTYDIKNEYLRYPNRFPSNYEPYSYDSHFDPDFSKYSESSSPHVFY